MAKGQMVPCQLQVGDIVYIFMGTAVFRKIARDTGSWTNHVGVVIDTSGSEPMAAESKFPFSTLTLLSKLLFWHAWYLGRIPWKLEAITPESLRKDQSTFSLIQEK